jgi:hypothetical protein
MISSRELKIRDGITCQTLAAWRKQDPEEGYETLTHREVFDWNIV